MYAQEEYSHHSSTAFAWSILLSGIWEYIRRPHESCCATGVDKAACGHPTGYLIFSIAKATRIYNLYPKMFVLRTFDQGIFVLTYRKTEHIVFKNVINFRQKKASTCSHSGMTGPSESLCLIIHRLAVFVLYFWVH